MFVQRRLMDPDVCSTNDDDSAFTNEDSEDNDPTGHDPLPDSVSDIRSEHGRGGLCLVRQSDDTFTVATVGADELSGEHRFQFVTTSDGLLAASPVPSSANQSRIKTTHIVIHNQTLSSSGISDDSPQTPLPPPTPATPQGREHGFRYQWDPSAFESVIPVRCKNSNGDLHKAKFGSGDLFLAERSVFLLQYFGKLCKYCKLYNDIELAIYSHGIAVLFE